MTSQNRSDWQKLLPQHFLSRFGGLIANCTIPFVKNYVINDFLKKYPVDLSEAEYDKAEDYQSFNDFFTRALKPGLRPIHSGKNTLICPVDGALSAWGRIEGGQLFQAKGHHYALHSLLASTDVNTLTSFEQGLYATLYLAPHDYHRVHMPLDGTLREMRYVPGRLFSVNKQTAEDIPDLFALNERVILFFDTAFGPMAVILVGAMIVASISTVFAGLVAPQGKEIINRSYSQNDEQHIFLQKGMEVGRFHLGSTVIMLLGNSNHEWEPLTSFQQVRLGQGFATLKPIQHAHPTVEHNSYETT